MARTKFPNVDVTFANGWLRGQVVVEHSTDGSRGIAPRLLARLRLDTILEYFEDEDRVLIVITAHNPKGVSFYGKAETLDDLAPRDAGRRLFEHDQVDAQRHLQVKEGVGKEGLGEGRMASTIQHLNGGYRIAWYHHRVQSRAEWCG